MPASAVTTRQHDDACDQSCDESLLHCHCTCQLDNKLGHKGLLLLADEAEGYIQVHHAQQTGT
jgi:hypothetical protein